MSSQLQTHAPSMSFILQKLNFMPLVTIRVMEADVPNGYEQLHPGRTGRLAETAFSSQKIQQLMVWQAWR
jgi:hypothetical protein